MDVSFFCSVGACRSFASSPAKLRPCFVVPMAAVALQAWPPEAYGSTAGCPVFTPGLCRVRWPARFRPALPPRYDGYRISGSGKTLEVRILGCARRSLSLDRSRQIARPISTNTKNERHKGLYWFGPPMWCNTLLQCGVVDCLLG